MSTRKSLKQHRQCQVVVQELAPKTQPSELEVQFPQGFYFIYLFWQCGGLNSGPYACRQALYYLSQKGLLALFPLACFLDRVFCFCAFAHLSETLILLPLRTTMPGLLCEF
jgi:hypothetical protein